MPLARACSGSWIPLEWAPSTSSWVSLVGRPTPRCRRLMASSLSASIWRRALEQSLLVDRTFYDTFYASVKLSSIELCLDNRVLFVR
jgi:hypothetical protein